VSEEKFKSFYRFFFRKKETNSIVYWSAPLRVQEMYFPPFEGAIKAGVLSVMCANNLVNGVYVWYAHSPPSL
jgi:beta-glucosidase-like glycosyl hydrolase